MILLALETATSVCSVALLREEIIEVEALVNRPRAHAELLVPMIEHALRSAHVTPSEVSAIAVSSGPGSYTGLRIGVSTAKGLAAAVDVPLVGVPSLEALAEAVRPFAAAGDRILTAFHARRDELFAAGFRVEGDELAPLHDTQAIRPVEAIEWLKEAGTTWLAGDGWTALAETVRRPGIRYLEEVQPGAASVARLGSRRLAKNVTENVATFEPHYLKEFVAKRPSASAFEKLPF